jgi:YVTN family beta-propeller protein
VSAVTADSTHVSALDSIGLKRAGLYQASEVAVGTRTKRYLGFGRPLSGALMLVSVMASMCSAQYVADSIQVPGAWVGNLVYNNREDVIYGASASSGWFFALSCGSKTVVSSFALGQAYRVCYDSIDNKAYCTATGTYGDSLSIIDGRTHRLIKALPMAGSMVPVWDPVSDRLYVSCVLNNSVAVIDCATDSLLCNIPVGRYPLKMYVNTLWRKLYVLNSDDGSVSIVDMNTNRVVKSIDVGELCTGYYCRRADKFYCGRSGEIVVLDGRTDTVAARIQVAEAYDVEAISGSDARDVVLASAADMDTRFYAIDAATDVVDAEIRAGDGSDAIWWSPLSDRFYCTSAFTREVVVLSGDGRQLLGTLPVGSCPFTIAASPVQRELYVGHLNRSKVFVIRDADEPWTPPSELDTALTLQLDPSPFRDRLSVASRTATALGEVRVFGQDGRLVRAMNVNGSAACELRVIWDGKDSQGRLVPPGVYLVTAAGGARAKTVKLR